ncbi:hypothetical protein RZS08_20085, partial [Arthrospira platensis SPKY1]|nr:hypothetical protein [Arthrospira platensis SPKY1]
LQREPGVNLFELERTFKQAEEIVQAHVPEARLMLSDFGDKEGIEGADKPGGYRGLLRIELVEQDQRERTQFEITEDLLARMQNLAGVDVKEVVIDPLSPDGETGLIIQVYGYDPEVRRDLSNGIREKLLTIPGINSVAA